MLILTEYYYFDGSMQIMWQSLGIYGPLDSLISFGTDIVD